MYPERAAYGDWTYLAYVSLSGKLLAMRRRLDPQAPGAPISPDEARSRAQAILAKEGVDLSRFDPPEIRSEQLARRTDLLVRFRDRTNPLVRGSTHGLHVRFTGDRFAGFGPWIDDPQETRASSAPSAASTS